MKYTQYSTKEQRYEKYLQIIENYRPMDDDFMRELFRNDLPLAQLVLRIITGIPDLQLTSQQTQYDMNRLAGTRSICLDVYATDNQGRKFDLEIQRADKGASPQRARYHSSMMDVEFLKANDKFTELPITYVIFITEHDVRGENKRVYHFKWIEQETGNLLGDGVNILFVNGAYNNPNDTSALAKLIHDFRCTKAEEMYTELLAEKTRYFKETREGVSEMCKAIEDLTNQVEQQAKMQAKFEERCAIARRMLEKGGMSFAFISEMSGLPVEDIEELAKSLPKNL